MAQDKSGPDLQVNGDPDRDGNVGSSRMEAFSDGVIAIIVTIMVLEFKAPAIAEADRLLADWPVFLAYLLSFTIVAIYWVNHHDLLNLVTRVSRQSLWLNMHWLFWLSLFPFATAYIGETRGAAFATSVYASIAFLVAAAFYLLQRSLIAENAKVARFVATSRRRLTKNLAAMGAMALAIAMAWLSEPMALLLLAVPPLTYLVPD